MSLKLSQLAPQDQGVIVQLHTEQFPFAFSRQLNALGLLPQTSFTFCRRAPFGSAIELKIRGTRICIREELAECIEVIKRDEIDSGGAPA